MNSSGETILHLLLIAAGLVVVLLAGQGINWLVQRSRMQRRARR